MDLKVDHHNDGTPDFVTSLILYGKKGTHTIVEPNKQPRLLVLRAVRALQNYDKEPNWYPVYHLTLMDGSKSLVQAVTSINKSEDIWNKEIFRGSTLIVKKYTVINLEASANANEWRMVLVVDKFGWKHPPGHNLDGRDNLATPPTYRAYKQSEASLKKRKTNDFVDPESFQLFWKPLLKVTKDNIVIFTEHVNDIPEQYRYNQPTNVEASPLTLANGNWIQDPVVRYDWCEMMKTSNSCRKQSVLSNQSECECVTRYKIKGCVAVWLPVDSICKRILMETCRNRCKGGHKLDDFTNWESVPDETKRWCLCFWYSVSIFQPAAFRPSIMDEDLPECVKKYIRCM